MENSFRKTYPSSGDGFCFFKILNNTNCRQLSFEITNTCNLRCLHCCNDSTESSRSFLSEGDMYSIIDEMHKNNVIAVYLTGGEPTSHPAFSDIVNYLHTKNIDIALATNGSYEISQFIPILETFNPRKDGVFVSIDGIDESHDTLRGQKGAFLRSLQTIKTLIAHNIKLRISSVIWAGNKDQLENMVLLAKNLGVQHIHFSILFSAGRARQNNIFIAPHDYKYVVKRVDELIHKYTSAEFLVSMRRNELLSCNNTSCRAGENLVHITSTGVVYPCSWLAKTALGQQYSMQWEKGNFERCTYAVSRFQKLVKERVEKYGYSGCPAFAFAVTNDPLGEDPLNSLLS